MPIFSAAISMAISPLRKACGEPNPRNAEPQPWLVADREALGADIPDIVTGAHELGLTQGHQVTEFGVRTVIEPPVIFQRDDLAVLVESPLGLDLRPVNAYRCR